ncbi:MAG: MFS transporter [Acidimicrobiales bacterium]
MHSKPTKEVQSRTSASSGAVIADLFPPERRGRAHGFNGIGWSMGAVLGIVLGPLIVTYISWRWIFWINVSTGIVATLLALRVLHDRGGRERHRIDLSGMIAAGLGLFGVLWAVTNLARSQFDVSILSFVMGGLVCLVAFVFIERVQPERMVRLLHGDPHRVTLDPPRGCLRHLRRYGKASRPRRRGVHERTPRCVLRVHGVVGARCTFVGLTRSARSAPTRDWRLDASCRVSERRACCAHLGCQHLWSFRVRVSGAR